MPDRTGEIPVDEHLKASHLSEVEFCRALSDYMKGRPMDPKREELERAVIETGISSLTAPDLKRFDCGYHHTVLTDKHMDALRALRDYLARPVWAPCRAAGRPAIENRRTAEAIMFSDGDPALRDRVLRLLNESEKK